ncbi:4-hydroxyphenylacetate decarboxylase small subunit [Oceanirhabdus seepicola]|uniref:4-hydroxyphenylacetate decarboxylase small subunit n=1 Tax=Oceanirhabdus seepicola TaxID=2828781 RepID=A0A9J6P255_9CLOT|nr:4-hydroxyphenylacetate decarboxylase small subunit [Oceanirhabdus seepicola]MCM1990850.1 4-hydroxyphenylacetate decarboxylase small subunit [Oceanirhabdus seepicola]
MNIKHNDCLHFSNIDAAKGICRLTGNIVEIDSDACASYDKKAKCKFCKNFTEESTDGIGTCVGLKVNDWVYGELNAVTCSSYEEK